MDKLKHKYEIPTIALLHLHKCFDDHTIVINYCALKMELIAFDTKRLMALKIISFKC